MDDFLRNTILTPELVKSKFAEIGVVPTPMNIVSMLFNTNLAPDVKILEAMGEIAEKAGSKNRFWNENPFY